jgi:hypothetical protein
MGPLPLPTVTAPQSRTDTVALVMNRLPLLTAVLLALAVTAQPSRAQPDAEMRRLREALAAIQQEQQAVFQQFQMVQGLRASQAPPSGLPGALVYTPPATPPRYEDVVRERDAYLAAQSRYQDELERLYARYRDLEERKRPLVERMAELAATPP